MLYICNNNYCLYMFGGSTRLESIKSLVPENRHLEYKECRENRLPTSIWETVSAFANTDGGKIILGVKEIKKKHLNIPVGITDEDKLKTDFLNTQKSGKLSKMVVKESDFETKNISDRKLLIINVNKISFTKRPIYLDDDIRKTYIRENESDRKANGDELKIFLRDADPNTDSELLDNFSMDDLNKVDIQNYYLELQDKNNDLFSDLSLEEFLKSMGLIKRDRSQENAPFKLTSAALLLFGKFNSITDVFPNFFLDFIEKTSPSSVDYDDRVFTSNELGHPQNIYSFYRIVAAKIDNNIKNGFVLRGDRRVDAGEDFKRITRESIVNSLVHADYSSKRTTKISMYDDYIEFDNPGEMRVSSLDFIQGGTSIARNPKIFDAFIRARLGEHTGSGGYRIYKTAGELKLRTPIISSSIINTKLILWKIPLIDSILKDMPEELRPTYKRIAEKLVVSYSDLKDLYASSYQGHNIINELVDKKYVKRSGKGKGTKYYLPSDDPSVRMSLNSYIQENLLGH